MKRFNNGQNGRSSPAKRPKTEEDGEGGGKKMSFAAKMMGKMGYKEGQGLGAEGSGILNPIEVKLRPQGAGVGAVKEKTAQAKAEEKRTAERRGERYEDSSEEEKKVRRKLKELRKKNGLPASSASRTSAKPKQKVRTAADIEAEEGFEVPNVFKSLIDMTGAQPKMITSSAGLFSNQSAPLVPGESESRKLANHARRELEAFADAWRDLEERKTYSHAQQDQILDDVVTNEKELEEFQGIHTAVQSLKISNEPDSNDLEQVEAVVRQLEHFQEQYSEAPERYSLDEVAVAALIPSMKGFLATWDPVADPTALAPLIHRIKPILKIQTRKEAADIDDEDEDILGYRSRKTATAFESMMYSLWLPKVRTAIINTWDPYEPTPMIALVENWVDLLPQFMYDIIINQLVVQRLSSCLDSWKIGSSRRDEPHLWLFPWLPYLDQYHLDPKSSNGLLHKVKRKFRNAFTSWKTQNGVIPGLEQWQEVKSFRDDLNRDMEYRLLPHLAQYLKDEFEFDPADQQLRPIDDVTKWLPVFKPEKFARIFLDSFFPRYFSILYEWLTSDEAIYDEVRQWFVWWQTVFPAPLRECDSFIQNWEKGNQLIETAKALGPKRMSKEVPRPDVQGASLPTSEEKIRTEQPQPTEKADKSKPLDEGVSFRELVEEACERENLLFVPLRKAHEGTGMPLFRITASASGTGGVTAYIRGDLLYVQDKKDKATWDVADIFDEGRLSELAEGR